MKKKSSLHFEDSPQLAAGNLQKNEKIFMAKIAVIVRNRQSEAFRMSIGLTVLNDTVDIFITEKLKKNKENSETHLEAIRDLRLKVYSTVSYSEPDCPEASFEYISPEAMADKLLEYDVVLPY